MIKRQALIAGAKNLLDVGSGVIDDSNIEYARALVELIADVAGPSFVEVAQEIGAMRMVEYYSR